MGQALYRKYRSKSLKEIVGQEHITQALDNALKTGRISHAYLLSGPRGVGKTSVARILAHAVNGLTYAAEQSHLDIIEIDAASNRRIDEIRELRERVHTAPTSARFKVYIIDEVHMLTREAFNALLKTLEEPPEHAIFILATTEPHRLPETIISRTQRYNFKPIEPETAVQHLRAIAKQESIDIDDEALKLIAQHGDGSFRDSISLLDQIAGHRQKVTLQDVQTMLGIAPSAAIDSLYEALTQGSPKELIALLSTLRQQGLQAVMVAKQLGQLVRQRLLDNTSSLPPELSTSLLQQLLSVPSAQDHDSWLEVILLKTNLKLNPQAKPQQQPPENPPEPTQPIAEEPPAVDKQRPSPKPPRRQSIDLTDVENNWQELLNTMKQHHNTLYSALRMATPQLNNDHLVLTFRFPFHQKRSNEAKNKQLISELVESSFGRALKVEFTVQPSEPTAPQPSIDTSPIESISNIFGSAELLES